MSSMTTTTARPDASFGIFSHTLISAVKACAVVAKRVDKAIPTLRSVRIEQHEDGAVVVATDSYKILAVVVGCDAPVTFDPVTVSVDDVTAAVKLKPSTIRFAGENVTFEGDGATYTARQVEGDWPNWRRLFNDPAHLRPVEAPVQFTPRHLADLAAALKALDAESTLWQIGNTDGGAIRAVEYVAAGDGWTARAAVVPSRANRMPPVPTL